LAQELEASDRTVQRYITYMVDSQGAPIIHDRGKGGYYYTDESFSLSGIYLTQGEILAMYIALPVVSYYRNTTFGSLFEKAFEKLVQYLPSKVRIDLKDMPKAVGYRGMSSTENTEVFETLLRAALKNQSALITYYTAARDETQERLIDPYVLEHVNGAWYVIGHCHLRGEVLTFHCGRVRSATLSDRSFKRPVTFKTDDYLKGAMGIYRDPDTPGVLRKVVLRFDEFASRFMRSTCWHPSQSIQEVDGGGIEVTLELDSLVEVEHLILGWAEHVEVLEPIELREGVRRHIDEMARVYSGAKAVG